ncbi:hypothetical protein PI125_g24659 [Phytophthora idaei]|nr:hypothetical protein PI125_g24659 [Phytophthora idaei]KAG3125569.1 hypothetical protein PI126_g22704 [Phytophthora idaei]
MAPTLRSAQLESSPVTLPASSQVMSPIRVHDSTTDAPGVEDPSLGGGSANGSRGARQLADNVADTATGRGDDVLSHKEAEHLIRSITGIQGGRSLVENLLEGLRARNLPVRNQPPPPNNPSDGGYSSGESSKAPSSRPSILDNQNPGGHYDDKELAEHTKSLRNTADIKLPSLSKKEDYQAWFSEVPLHFESRLLGEITYGAERFDSVEGYQRPKYAEWYKARKVKAFSALALSLSVDLRTTFKIDSIRDQMEAPSLLWQRITDHFEAGDGVNPDYLRRELMNRQLQSKEAVT